MSEPQDGREWLMRLADQDDAISRGVRALIERVLELTGEVQRLKSQQLATDKARLEDIERSSRQCAHEWDTGAHPYCLLCGIGKGEGSDGG